MDALLNINTVEPEKTDSGELKKGFGDGKGIIAFMFDNFDAPLEDFKDYIECAI